MVYNVLTFMTGDDSSSHVTFNTVVENFVSSFYFICMFLESGRKLGGNFERKHPQY